jgi:hypothetical protein
LHSQSIICQTTSILPVPSYPTATAKSRPANLIGLFQGLGFVWRNFTFRGGLVRRRQDFFLRFYYCSYDQLIASFGRIDRARWNDSIGCGESRFFAGQAQFQQLLGMGELTSRIGRCG